MLKCRNVKISKCKNIEMLKCRNVKMSKEKCRNVKISKHVLHYTSDSGSERNDILKEERLKNGAKMTY
jgi:hypothetical protein